LTMDDETPRPAVRRRHREMIEELRARGGEIIARRLVTTTACQNAPTTAPATRSTR
jgi:hypothetical protein